MDGAQLDRYRANPIFGYGHRYWGRDSLPIGRSEHTEVDDSKRLMFDIRFDRKDDFAATVERKYRDGYLNAVSIGFSVVEWEDPKTQDYWRGGTAVKWELYELSSVPLPMDASAVVESGRGGLGVDDDLLQSVRGLLDRLDAGSIDALRQLLDRTGAGPLGDNTRRRRPSRPGRATTSTGRDAGCSWPGTPADHPAAARPRTHHEGEHRVDINARKKERASLAKQARDILDTAQADGGRRLTAEESEKFDRLMADVDGHDQDITREERLRAKERRIDGDPDDQPTRENNGPDRAGDGERAAAFRQYIVGGRSTLSPEQARTLQAGSDPEGGYLVAPQKWVSGLLQRLDDEVFIRRWAHTETLTEAASLGVPTLDTDLDDAEWTTEFGTGNQDDSLRFGKRELTPNPLAKRVKVSRKLLRLTRGNAEDIVRDRLAYKFAVSQEKAFMTGDGNKKPLGLFTASPMGISTGRDVTVGDISDDEQDINADGLIDMKYTLKAGYLANARWLFHRDTVKRIRKLKDQEGVYIWRPGLATDRPDTILDLPFGMSEFCPNTYTDGQYVTLLGDFKKYWIADALNMEVQRLVELYAETNQVGFIGRLETDGMPVLEEAFVRGKVVA
nr:phage major capsid protein [Micromonospora tarapacensis]